MGIIWKLHTPAERGLAVYLCIKSIRQLDITVTRCPAHGARGTRHVVALIFEGLTLR